MERLALFAEIDSGAVVLKGSVFAGGIIVGFLGLVLVVT